MDGPSAKAYDVDELETLPRFYVKKKKTTLHIALRIFELVTKFKFQN